MATEIKLPNLGENIDSGDVLSILVSEGDSVEKDQDLLEIETDKATAAVPSPAAGTIVKILVSEGDTVNVGAAIFEIDASANGAAAPAKEEPKKAPPKPEPVAEQKEPEPEPEPAAAPGAASSPTPAETPAETPTAGEPAVATAPKSAAPTPTTPAGGSPGDGVASAAAGPSVRRLARELGVDLRRVRPSGSGGRITDDDVRSHVRAAQQQAASNVSPGVTPPGSPESDGQGAVRVEKMSRMRKTIAANMIASYTTIPQLTNFDDVDVTELEEMRQQSKDDYAKRGLKLSQMPFLIKAIASSLRLHPIVNASVDMEAGNVIYKEYVNIGIAVDTDRGLMVPVLRDVDRLSISQVAREMDRLIGEAREGTLAIEEMRGGTFTISNMGAVGGTYSTPIINPPEVAILLVGRSRLLPTIVDEETIEARLIMPLSLTYDHRVVDGADAARFVNSVKDFLSAPGRLLLAP